jgi:hypothetical protein
MPIDATPLDSGPPANLVPDIDDDADNHSPDDGASSGQPTIESEGDVWADHGIHQHCDQGLILDDDSSGNTLAPSSHSSNS